MIRQQGSPKGAKSQSGGGKHGRDPHYGTALTSAEATILSLLLRWKSCDVKGSCGVNVTFINVNVNDYCDYSVAKTLLGT